jgi:hypothetical protein
MQNGAIPASRAKSAQLTRESAEAVAIDVLTFIAAEPVRLERFMTLSGLTPDGLRAAAAEPGFLAGVLDHLAGDEALLLAFAANAGRDPSIIAKARDWLSPPAEEG